jgi:hypothetical protein
MKVEIGKRYVVVTKTTRVVTFIVRTDADVSFWNWMLASIKGIHFEPA